MPAIVLLVNAQGALALDASSNVVTTGKVVVKNLTSLGGKAFACAGVAADADVSASASVNVSVSASSLEGQRLVRWSDSELSGRSGEDGAPGAVPGRAVGFRGRGRAACFLRNATER